MRELIDALDRRPKICVWEITSRCNMRCRHCASDFGPGINRGGELTLDECLKLADDLRELRCERVVLSGGEALLRPDWPLIARHLVAIGIRTSLITNGYLVDAEMAHRIREAGIHRVGLSLDGLEETHCFVRRNPQAFARVVAAAGHLVSAGVLVNIVTHVNSRNIGELAAMEDLVVSLAADVWRIQLGSPLGRLSRHDELLLSPGQTPDVADFIVGAIHRRRVRISVGDNIGYFSEHEPVLRDTPERGGLNFWCGCSAGCLNIGIEANGNVKGCLSLQSAEFVEGNIRDESLADIWNRPDAFSFTRQFEPGLLTGVCKDCEYGEICRGGCVFMAVGATGKPHENPYCLRAVMTEKAESSSSSTVPEHAIADDSRDQ